MNSSSTIIRIKGENVTVPSIVVNERNLICRPGWIKIAEVQDEAFVEGEILPDPKDAVTVIKGWKANPDILTFSQKFTETDKEYPFHKEWDDFAVIPISTYAHWKSKQIKKDVKENLRRALNRESVEVRSVEYTQEFVKGIKQLYDETPIRQGKKFWHYDKPLEKIEEVHGTYKERAEYIGAYFENELIGFLKMVYTDNYAKTMHVISNSKYHRKRPTNALIAKAVEICAQKEVSFFVYGEYNFIGKANSSLQEFKRRNGFLEYKYPRYFVPLTLKGKIALKLGVHYEWKRLVPNPIKNLFLKTRALFATQQLSLKYYGQYQPISPMPGIAGLLTHSKDPKNQSRVETMIESMKHESFYRSGIYSDEEVGVSVGWTAMEEGFCPTQPVCNEDGKIMLFLSGECFADPSLLATLKSKGHQFTDASCEWLVHYYEESGNDFFKNINGIFSGLLIDKRRDLVFLFNDRFGIERIYTHRVGKDLYFASEAKAILRISPETRSFSKEGLNQFINYNCTVNWKSLFKGIDVLPGASIVEFSRQGISQKQYFEAKEWEEQETLSESEFLDQYESVFDRIVPNYFSTKHSLGVSLTAGLDTRMIMACLPDIGAKPNCYTFGGVTGRTLDASIAGKVANALGLEHSIIRVEKDFFSDFQNHVERSIYITDGNFGVTGAHEVYMNAKARALGKVRLTGNFGGEILRGVSTFKPIAFSADILSMDIRSEVKECAINFSKEQTNPFTFAAFKEIPWNLYGSLFAGRSQLTFRTPYLDNELVQLAYRSPESFRTSRVGAVKHVQSKSPLLAGIPTDKAHLGSSRGIVSALKKLHSHFTFKLDYYNNEGLPSVLSSVDPLLRHLTRRNFLLGHHKHLHYRTWLRKELSDFLLDSINDSQVLNNPIWNKEFLKKMAKNHIEGKGNFVSELNTVLTIAGIEKVHLRSR